MGKPITTLKTLKETKKFFIIMDLKTMYRVARAIIKLALIVPYKITFIFIGFCIAVFLPYGSIQDFFIVNGIVRIFSIMGDSLICLQSCVDVIFPVYDPSLEGVPYHPVYIEDLDFIFLCPRLDDVMNLLVWTYNPSVFDTISNFVFTLNFSSIYCHMDAAEPYQLGLQDPATPVMEGIVGFHSFLMVFLVGIASFVGWLLFQLLTVYIQKKKLIGKEEAFKYRGIDTFTHATLLEIVWTIIPAVVLLTIAVPSFSLLYSVDETIDPSLTLKIVGHQWYWGYEYSDYKDIIIFDAYMLPPEELTIGQFRLLEVDNRVVLPFNTHIRLLITSGDVLHSWAVPSFGVKLDAIPGRLSQTSLFIKRVGTYYGQCSEICGTNHGFMPIVVRSVDVNSYIVWAIGAMKKCKD